MSEMGFKLRTFRGGDEHNIIALWNSAMPSDVIGQRTFLRKVLLDPNFDSRGLIVAESAEGQLLVGFILAMVRKTPIDAGENLDPDKGWISAVGVSPSWRRRGVARALLQAAETFIQGQGRQAVIVSSYTPGYFWPGIDTDKYAEAISLFKGAGYVHLDDAVAMDIDLVPYEIPRNVMEIESRLRAEGFRFEYLTLGSVAPLLDFVRVHFSPGWVGRVRQLLLSTTDWERVIVSKLNEQVVGYCQFGDPDGVLERFGPFGVRPDMQGKGLGKVLLSRCLETMKKQGLHTAWFLWSEEHSPAGKLYKKTGFKFSRRFHIMQKNLG